MKLPTSTKPTSGFHICDILELNKDQKQKKDLDNKNNDEKSKADDDDDEIEMKREHLSCESEENLTAKSSNLSPSPTSPTNITRESKSSIESAEDSIHFMKHMKRDEERPSLETTSGHHQLLSDTLHQYPHLFQNHPAMRPWFNSNGKLSQIRNSLVNKMER